MKLSRLLHLNQRHVQGTYLAVLLTILALGAGWWLKSSVNNQFQNFTDKGVNASIPAKWLVRSGLASDELVFSANPPLDINYRFEVELLPVTPGGKITDLVINRNYTSGQNLHYYRVNDQNTTQVQGKSAYQVSYSYIKTDTPTNIPIVIKGTNFYIPFGDKILLVTLENSEASYEESLPQFNAFLAKITYTGGGLP